MSAQQKINRKAGEEYVIRRLSKIDPSGRSSNYAKEQFAKMDDKRFMQFVDEVDKGEAYITVLMPNHMNGKPVTVGELLDVCESEGVRIFQRYWYINPQLGMKALSNDYIPFVHLTVRRQIETLMNKLRTSGKRGQNDVYTGQGVKDAAAMTQSESNIYLGKGLENTLVEKLKYRGGDIAGGREFDRQLIENGTVSTQQLLKQQHTSTRSVQTLDIFLTSAHYDTNIDPTKG